MLNDDRAGEIAGKLSPAQRRVLVQGFTSPAAITTLWALEKKGLMHVRYADPNPETSGWKPTPLGLAVRRILEGRNHVS